MANLAGVLKELEQERSRLDQAIQIVGQLVGRNSSGVRARRAKRTLSAAGRRKISLAQKGETNIRAHHEPSSTQQDCCGTARSLGEVEGSAEEGGVRKR